MKWIKYEYLGGTKPDGGRILIKKKIGYNEENLVIAQAEAYNSQYTIEDDGKGEPNSQGYMDITVTDIEGGHRITFKDIDEEKTVDVMDGKNGDAGAEGASFYYTPGQVATTPEGENVLETENIQVPSSRRLKSGDLIYSARYGDICVVKAQPNSDEVLVDVIGNIKGAKGDTGPAGKDGTPGATKAEIIAELSKETWVFTLANGNTVEKVVPIV